MKCHELAKETGWTPIQAFQEVVDEKELAQELKNIRDGDRENKTGQVQQVQLLTSIKCITP